MRVYLVNNGDILKFLSEGIIWFRYFFLLYLWMVNDKGRIIDYKVKKMEAMRWFKRWFSLGMKGLRLDLGGIYGNNKVGL